VVSKEQERLERYSRPRPDFSDRITLQTFVEGLMANHIRNELPKSGSLHADLRRLSPADQKQALQIINDFHDLKNGFHEPFKPTPSLEQFADHYGIEKTQDALDLAERINATMEHEHVQGSLLARMGSDADRPPEPVTLRDQVAAAVDLHSGE
jgi:hypothetical protein